MLKESEKLLVLPFANPPGLKYRRQSLADFGYAVMPSVAPSFAPRHALPGLYVIAATPSQAPRAGWTLRSWLELRNSQTNSVLSS